MGKLSSVFMATLQYAFGIYIFKKPDVSECGPLLASLLVLLALFLVLWTLSIYPKRLRKLISLGDAAVQYLLATFLIEHIMSCFWFPLETAVLAFLPKCASFLEENLLFFDVTCHFPCDLLRREGMGIFISYMLSFLVLLAALHATRVINLTLLLSGGINLFIYDLSRRSKKFIKNFPGKMGIRNLRYGRYQKSGYCISDDEDAYIFEPGADDERSDNNEYHYS